MMHEAQRVADRLGVKFVMDIEKRINGAENVGAHKTSMLQDFDQGRPLEIDALVASVSELGRLVDVPTPTLDAVLSMVLLKMQGINAGANSSGE
jgi:2-dehydropantoate 2-reductase